MDSSTYDYVTRGGIEIEIELPLGSNGNILPARYLSDSERRKLQAIMLKENDRTFTTFDSGIPLH